MENVQRLLQEINEIRIHHEAMIEATGGRFNIFKIVGVNHYENTHSAIIAEFLNPEGTHGLKSKLLECFIETLNGKFMIQSFNFEKARVRTEHFTDEGRLDILIEDNKNKAIIIENKINASDQSEQLKRYDKYAQTYQNGYQILYLTLLGKNATNQSGEGVRYLPISYKEHIIKWIEKCVSITASRPLVRETLFQYINHLKQLTNTDMDSTLNEQIVKHLTENVESFKSAIAINNGLEDAKYRIFNNFVDNISEKVKLERLKLPNQSINEFGFIYKNYYPYFGKIGVRVYVSIRTEKSLNGQEVFYPEDKMNIFNKKQDSYTPFGYSFLDKDHWSNNNKVFVEMMMYNSDLENEIIDWIDKMKNAINSLTEM